MAKTNNLYSNYTQGSFYDLKPFDTLNTQNFDARKPIKNNCFCGDEHCHRPPYVNRPTPYFPYSPYPTNRCCPPPFYNNCCCDDDMFWFTFGYLIGKNNCC